MRNLFILTFLFATTTFNSFGQVPSLQWGHGFGSSNADYAHDIKIDASGNSIITGAFSGVMDVDPGANILNLTPSGGFVQKLDQNGNLLWAFRMGSVINDFAIDSNGGIYLAGLFSGTEDFDPGVGSYPLTAVSPSSGNNVFVLKIDAAGNFVWATSFGTGTNSMFCRSIAVNSSNEVALTGRYGGAGDFDPSTSVTTLTSNGSNDIYTIKFDASGSFLWAKSTGDTGSDQGWNVNFDSFGNIITNGVFDGTVDFDPSGSTFNLTATSSFYDAFIQKLSPNGNLIIAKSYGGPNGHDYPEDVVLDSADNMYICGMFGGTADFDPNVTVANATSNGSIDGYILKLDNNLNFSWVNSIGGTFLDYFKGLCLDTQGNVFATGYFSNTVDFDPGIGVSNLISFGGYDIFTMKYDNAGVFQWVAQSGGINDDEGADIAEYNGAVYTFGTFELQCDFDPDVSTNNIVSNGDKDYFIQKLNNCVSSSSIDVISTCNSYVWIDGNTYISSNNTATHILTNSAGCDSVITLDLTINYSNSGTDVQTACDSYLWIDGNTYTSSNNSATHTLVNSIGCDSVVTLNLTINTVNTGITSSDPTLMADAVGASYQWLECPSLTPISGATSQLYTATQNGDYAVVVTENGCTDTTSCVTIATVGIIENNFGNELLLYPNPTDGNFSVDLGETYNTVTISIMDLNGRLIKSKSYNEGQLLNLYLDEPTGIYILKIESSDKIAVFRLIKE